jgi:hypothetical protein
MQAMRFECQAGCTRCCDTKGWVYVTEGDLRAAAKYLGMTRKAFEEKYVYRTKHQIRLRKPPEKQCHFLEAGGCSIHEVKPVQCRLYPFWPELVEDRKAWERERVKCPGIGKGGLVQIGTAVETASEMKRAYPWQYEG